MEHSDQDIELAMGYVSGMLPDDAARLHVKERITQDEQFAALVRVQSELSEGIIASGLKNQMDSWHGEIPKAQPKSSMNYSAIGIAASVAILAGVMLFFFLKQPSANEALFLAYHAPFPDRVSQRAGGQNEALTQAMQLYNARQYEAAYPAFMKIMFQDSSFLIAQFYGGISALELNKSQDAIGLFNFVILAGEGPYFLPSKWYKSLALLRNEDIREAKAALQGLVDSGSSYQARAQSLLVELNQISADE